MYVSVSDLERRSKRHSHVPNPVFTCEFPYVLDEIEAGRFFPVQDLLLGFLLLQLVPGIRGQCELLRLRGRLLLGMRLRVGVKLQRRLRL